MDRDPNLTSPSRDPQRRRRSERRGRRRRRGWLRRQARAGRPARLAGLALLALLTLGVAVTSWLGLQAWRTSRGLSAARADAEQIRVALLAGDVTSARSALGAVQRHAGTARAASSGPMWRAASRLPRVGADLRAVGSVSQAVDDLADRVLPPLVQAGDVLSPRTLRSGDSIAIDRLVDAAPALQDAADAGTAVRDRLDAVHPDGLHGPVRQGVLDAQRVVDSLTGSTGAAARAARLLPPMLGADGTRRYFLAFQNNAEARGTGGLLGAYGVLEADRGRLRVVRLGPNTELRSPRRMPLDFGADYRARYGENPALVVNANLSPHFPYAARLWLEAYRRQTGRRLDGVIATDPVALGYVLAATGPARLPDGTQVTSANAVDLTLRDVYAKYPTDDARRDAYLQQVAQAAFARLLSGSGDPGALVRQLGRAAGEGRLLAYSTRADEQRQLAATPLAGELAAADRPYAAVVVNNGAGNKLDYYLERSLRFTAGGCVGAERASRIEVTLRNAVPPGPLPPYVTLRLDRDAVTRRESAPRGSNVALVQVYGTRGASLDRATLDGRDLLVEPGEERGHPVFAFRVVLARGQARTAVLTLTEPVRRGPAVTPVQPLVRAERVTAGVPAC